MHLQMVIFLLLVNRLGKFIQMEREFPEGRNQKVLVGSGTLSTLLVGKQLSTPKDGELREERKPQESQLGL